MKTTDLPDIGGIELFAVKFPGTHFTGVIIDALNELVDTGSIRIVDLVFASKNHDGEVRVLELRDLDAESVAALEPLVEDRLGVFSAEDVAHMGAVLQNGSSAGLMLLENSWRKAFSPALELSAQCLITPN